MVEVIKDEKEVEFDSVKKVIRVKRQIVEEFGFDEFERTLFRLENTIEGTKENLESTEEMLESMKPELMRGLIKKVKDKDES